MGPITLSACMQVAIILDQWLPLPSNPPGNPQLHHSIGPVHAFIDDGCCWWFGALVVDALLLPPLQTYLGSMLYLGSPSTTVDTFISEPTHWRSTLPQKPRHRKQKTSRLIQQTFNRHSCKFGPLD
eukprot:3696300-Amphidinium_carterae.1